jgi:hypothetical protein
MNWLADDYDILASGPKCALGTIVTYQALCGITDPRRSSSGSLAMLAMIGRASSHAHERED